MQHTLIHIHTTHTHAQTPYTYTHVYNTHAHKYILTYTTHSYTHIYRTHSFPYIHTSIQHTCTQHIHTHAYIYTCAAHTYTYMCAQHNHTHIHTYTTHSHIHIYDIQTIHTQHTYTHTYTHIHSTHFYKHQSQEWVKETHHEIKCLCKPDKVLEIRTRQSPKPPITGELWRRTAVTGGSPVSGKGAGRTQLWLLKKIGDTMSSLGPPRGGTPHWISYTTGEGRCLFPPKIYTEGWGHKELRGELWSPVSWTSQRHGHWCFLLASSSVLSWTLQTISQPGLLWLLVALTTGIPLHFSCTFWITFSQKHNHNHCFAYDAMRSGNLLTLCGVPTALHTYVYRLAPGLPSTT